MSESQLAPKPPSGKQFTISDDVSRAVVTQVGAGLREFSVDGVAVLWGYGAGEIAGAGRGQVLAPWPNRIEDGAYDFDGRRGRVPLDEPDRRNAIHGLVRWLYWQLDRHDSDSVSLVCELAPQPAYPWRLRLAIEYRVTAGGLLVTTAAENLSEEVAPFGLGFHPYLHAGPEGADGCTLTLPAPTHLLADERAIPRSRESVDGSPFDFREGRQLAGVTLDDCFCGLAGQAQQRLPEGADWEVVLDKPDGRVGLWGGPEYGYVMCYTGDTLAVEDQRRGVAIEPMTCPPNAFRSGEALIRLSAGERFQARFGIRSLS